MKHPIAVIERLFPSILCRTRSGGIHLTFDDGPHPQATSVVLDILKQYGVHATFFLCGENVRKYPDLTRRIVEEGHEAENHGYTHRNYFWCRSAIVRDELLKTSDAIMRCTHSTPKYFRPPFGCFRMTTLKCAEQCSLQTVLWSLDSKDYQYREQTFERSFAGRAVRNGDILLLHDNELTSESVGDTLRLLLDSLLEHHYNFSLLEL
jgi:peptidoglycan/xylan/chitin deacetylase (PgdA/CDA1 family)